MTVLAINLPVGAVFLILAATSRPTLGIHPLSFMVANVGAGLTSHYLMLTSSVCRALFSLLHSLIAWCLDVETTLLMFYTLVWLSWFVGREIFWIVCCSQNLL